MAVNAANMAEDFLRRRVEDGVPERPPCVKVKGPKDIDRITVCRPLCAIDDHSPSLEFPSKKEAT